MLKDIFLYTFKIPFQISSKNQLSYSDRMYMCTDILHI